MARNRNLGVDNFGMSLNETIENSNIISISPNADSSQPQTRRESQCMNCGGDETIPEGNFVIKIPPQRRASIDDKSKPSLSNTVKKTIKRCCRKKILYKRVPILEWLPKYSMKFAIADLIAGITVGLTVIPQAIVFTTIADVPTEYGLYSAFLGCFIYTVFGSCKNSAIGPSAVVSLLTGENTAKYGPDFAVLLTFLGGCVELLMGVLHLGFLINFISGPVSIGFTSASALVVVTAQIKDLLGIQLTGSTFIEIWKQVFSKISETRLWDAVLGFSCIAILLVLRKLKDIPIGPDDVKERSTCQKILSNFFWFVTIARNIIVVLISSTLAFYFFEQDVHPFILTGHVKPGLPAVSPPPFSSTVGDKSYNFFEMADALGSSIFVIPLLAILENIALNKAFSEGTPIDASQEMLALGICNIASSFVSSIPITGALARGAVNNASGVQTTFGGIYTGVIVILALEYFTPYFYFIPKAALAAVLISTVIFMVEFSVIKPIWKSKKIDLLPALATFTVCLFLRLELGILVGIAINVIFLLYASARPKVHVDKLTSLSGCFYLLVTPDRSLRFPSVEYVRKAISKAGIKMGASAIPVVIDAKYIQGADFTTAEGMKSLIDDFARREQPLIFYNVRSAVVSTFQGVKPTDLTMCQTPIELNDTLKEYAPIGIRLSKCEKNPLFL